MRKLSSFEQEFEFLNRIISVRMLQEESSEEDIDAEELEKVLENFLKEISEQQVNIIKIYRFLL